VPDFPAVDPHGVDAGGRLLRGLEGGGVADGRRIEQHQISKVADGDAAAVPEPEALGRKSGHAPDCLGEGEETDIAGVMAEHAGECAPQPGMGMLLALDAVWGNFKMRRTSSSSMSK